MYICLFKVCIEAKRPVSQKYFDEEIHRVARYLWPLNDLLGYYPAPFLQYMNSGSGKNASRICYMEFAARAGKTRSRKILDLFDNYVRLLQFELPWCEVENLNQRFEYVAPDSEQIAS